MMSDSKRASLKGFTGLGLVVVGLMLCGNSILDFAEQWDKARQS